MEEQIAVVGLGYVGLPVALAFARQYPGTIGFDINAARVDDLRRGVDRSGEQDPQPLLDSSIRFTADPAELVERTFFVVAVPTPVDADNRPDLTPLEGASRIVGQHLTRGAVVVYESTVYPGVTEEICGPILERESGLKAGIDFKLGYSPERINPGDREHTLERIMKIVSGQDPATLERVADAYGRIITAGIHRAPSIKVAEAAKVIENTQRDLNIALMNEIAVISDLLGIRTSDVLAAARTKWNFLPFAPGLVGGHCVGVDPYYLTTKAEQLGYQPEVILAGRRINNRMAAFIVEKLVKLLINADQPVKGARIGIMGLTFKENVSDLRNSRVPDIVRELGQYGISPLVHDPLGAPAQALHEYGIQIQPLDDLTGLDALILAVPHAAYLADGLAPIFARVKPGGVLIDVKSAIAPADIPADLQHWSL
ncbi:MAG TPA: nucleotide sugar dehydrogenase [Candidatus Limnocylindrales bacterium]|nr:nucleotide sugar dehydrogenase [Candidatus Limnocylindrales bacterium]